MWSRCLIPGVLMALAQPALADYARTPFHDRAFAVADLALTVLAADSPVAVPDDTALAAAVAAVLLLSERGLSEAYEEAVEDDGEGAYAAAFGMLQKLRPWVGAVATDAQTAELMARLDALLPTPERPARLDADPVAAEAVAQALVGHLERVADADLYLSRDLSHAIDTVSDLTAQGCAVDGVGRARWLDISALYYEDALEAPLSVLAPEQAEQFEDWLKAVAAGDPSACETLDTAFADAKRRLFP